MRALLVAGLLTVAPAFAQQGSSGAPTAVCSNMNYSLPDAVDGNFNATSISAVPTAFCSFSGYVAAQTPVWLFVYDETTVPNPAQDVPMFRFYLPPQQTFDVVVGVQTHSGLGFALVSDPPQTPAPLNLGFSGVVGLNLGYHP